MLLKGEQCGGNKFNGTTVCSKGLKCTVIYKIDRIAVCKDSNPAKTTTAKPKATNKAVAPKQTASNKLGMHSKSEQQSKQQEIINNPGLTLITDLAPIQDNSSASSAQPPSTTLGTFDTSLPSPMLPQSSYNPATNTLWLGLIVGIFASIATSLIMLALVMRTRNLKKKMVDEDLRWKNVIEDIRNSI